MHRESSRRDAGTRGSPRAEDCPTDEDLICLTSGELSSAESREFNRHLDGCSSCQANLRELRAILQTCAIVAGEEAEPRDEGREQYAEFRRAIRSRTRSERQSSRSFGRLLLVAAVLLAAALPVVITRATQYDAETIVERAVVHEQRERLGGALDEPLRFYWIPEHKTPAATEKELASNKAHRRGRSSLPDAAEPTREIVALLDTHGFNRREPLSASRLAAWRAALPAHNDKVLRRDGLLFVRTTAQHGQLREVIVVIREDSWRVVGQAWVFLDLGRLQVERLGSNVFSSMSQAGAPRREVATR